MRTLITEARALWRGLIALDRQTVVVLIMAAALGMWKYTFGSRNFFDAELAAGFGVDGGSIWGYVYLFGTQAITGFVIPVAILLLVFRQRPKDVGLGLGDGKLGLSDALYILRIIISG